MPSAPSENAIEHFDWLGRMLPIDSVASSAITRELMGWQPTHPNLLEDLELGHYFQTK